MLKGNKDENRSSQKLMRSQEVLEDEEALSVDNRIRKRRLRGGEEGAEGMYVLCLFFQQ